MRFKALSDKGKKRSANEDNFFIKEEAKFFMVADGMGGHAAGEVASQTAVDSAADFSFDLAVPLESLSSLIYQINQEIINKSQQNQEYRGMGTTFAAVIVKSDTLYYVNLGDSRIYLYNKQEQNLRKISKDHSLVADLLRQGKITEEEAFNHPKKNIVTQALGLDNDLDL
ncbi:MAG: protein phosphatase 2C domain-containing protein, partial [Halanaerobium sp.]